MNPKYIFLYAVAIWPVTGQGFQILNGRQSVILNKFHKIEKFQLI